MSGDAQQEQRDDELWEELKKTVDDESQLVTIYLNRDENGFGFNIRGGVDHPHVGCDPGIFVTAVRADSVACQDGRLCLGDRILAVNNIRLDNVPHDDAVKAFRTSENCVALLVEKEAESKLLGGPCKTPKSPKPPFVGSFPEEDASTIKNEHKPSMLPALRTVISSFFSSSLGGLSLGIIAGSLAVFVGLRVYRAMPR